MQTESLGKESRRKAVQHEPVKASLVPGTPLGKLVSSSMHTSVVLAEVLILPALCLLLGRMFSPQDPLWVQAEFPWAWLAPLVIALRYGALAGLGSSLVLLAGWFLAHWGSTRDFPQLYFLGGLITVMLAGEFSSLWRAQTRRAESVQHYLDQRLDHLVRQYYLLRLSHDRLEQELIGRPMSLRDALQKLQASTEHQQAPDSLLQLLGQYCQITVASLHAMQDGQVLPATLAKLGGPNALDTQDPLLRQALETLTLSHVVQTTAQQQKSRYLIVAPLLDLGGTPYALLVVEEMPFFALQAENLQTINLFLGYYTDGLSAKALALPLLSAYPDCPERFAVEMQRLSHMYTSSGVRSVLVVLEFSSEAISHNLPQQLLRMKRMLDEYWLMAPRGGKQLLAVLMPLGDAASAEGFLQRLEQWIDGKQGGTLAGAGIYPHVFVLDQQSPLELLQRMDGLLHD